MKAVRSTKNLVTNFFEIIVEIFFANFENIDFVFKTFFTKFIEIFRASIISIFSNEKTKKKRRESNFVFEIDKTIAIINEPKFDKNNINY